MLGIKLIVTVDGEAQEYVAFTVEELTAALGEIKAVGEMADYVDKSFEVVER